MVVESVENPSCKIELILLTDCWSDEKLEPRVVERVLSPCWSVERFEPEIVERLCADELIARVRMEILEPAIVE